MGTGWDKFGANLKKIQKFCQAIFWRFFYPIFSPADATKRANLVTAQITPIFSRNVPHIKAF